MASAVILATDAGSIDREHLTEAVAPWEDGQRIEPVRGTFEWWYFDAHFEDGSTAVLVLSTKPLLERKGPLKPMVQIMLTRPDGTRAESLPTFNPNEFKASRQGCDVQIGPNWAKGDLATYQVHVEIGALAADLTFHGMVPPWRPGAGKVYFGDERYLFAWLPSLPFGLVAGTLVYDGQVHQVSGTGYHDHNWGNVGIEDVLDHWYWGRARVGDFTLIFVQIVAARKYGYQAVPIFLLADGDRVLIGDGAPLSLTTTDFVRDPGGRGYPRRLDFNWKADRGAVHLALQQPALIEAISMLYSFPPWQQKLLRLFANPYYFRFNAQLALTVDLDNRQANAQGQALFEVMILQGKKHP